MMMNGPNFKSSAFRRGFRDGLIAPSLIFKNNDYERAAKIESSASGAWVTVFKVINQASHTIMKDKVVSTKGEKKIGKASGKGARQRQRVAA
jgi:hypothetical protein